MNLMSFDSPGTLTIPFDNAGAATAATLHIGSPDSALDPAVVPFTPGPYAPVENISIGPSASGNWLGQHVIISQNANAIGLFVYTWQDGAHPSPYINNAIEAVSTSSAVIGGAPVVGFQSQPMATNGSNITGDDVGEFGYVAGYMAEPGVGINSHADYVEGAHLVPNIIDDTSSTSALIGVRVIPRFLGLAGTGIATNIYGFRADAVNGQGVSSNTYQFYATATVASTNNFSFFSDAVSGANNWAFYNASGKSLFDQVQIGAVTKYNSQPTVGNGIAATVGADDQATELTGNYGPVTLLAATAPTGFYLVTIYIEVSTGVATGTIVAGIAYADDTGAQTQTGLIFSAATTGTIQTLTFPVRFVTGTILSYATVTANNPKYKIFARATAI